MIAFVTALECSLRRLHKLMACKTDCDPRLLVVSVEVATLNDGWSFSFAALEFLVSFWKPMEQT